MCMDLNIVLFGFKVKRWFLMGMIEVEGSCLLSLLTDMRYGRNIKFYMKIKF